MEYLRCKNWERFQRYRNDRGAPPWIALHRRLQRDIEWVKLTSEQRGWLVDIWMLAAERNGAFPADPALLQKLCGMDRAPDLRTLQHFIEQPLSELDEERTDSGMTLDLPEERRGYTEKKEHCASSDARFEDWWKEYPVKKNKKKARHTWKIRKLDKIAETIIADTIDRTENDPQWKRGFIPHPTTYINGDRWEDDYADTRQQGSSNPVREREERNRRALERAGG